MPFRFHRLVVLLACGLLTVVAPQAGWGKAHRVVFSHSPADPSRVAVLIPRGNVNSTGGHTRPVKHMYMQYLAPFGGGGEATDVDVMAEGQIVLFTQTQRERCVLPDPAAPGRCTVGPGATQLVDDFAVFIQHSDEVTSYYDHLQSINPGLGLPDWHDTTAGWVAFGSDHLLFLGAGGARPPVRVHPGERLGATRNYSGAWDIGVVDTRSTGAFLGSGPLRYPTIRELFTQWFAEGGPDLGLGPSQPFPGEMILNSTIFLDYLTPRLAAVWRAKLAGDGSGGRPDWDVADTLQGNWYRAAVTSPTFANMLAAEDNAVSFSPFNYNPAVQTQVAIGENFLANLPPVPPGLPPAAQALFQATLDAATERLRAGLLFTPDRTPGTHHNPDPLGVPPGGHGCYDIPDLLPGDGDRFDGQTHSLLVYLPIVSGVQHMKLRYFAAPCTSVLTAINTNPSLPERYAFWGDYVR